ncbi:MAG: ABC transporter ATP-binding protein, partial [Anaerolineae bacterium]
IRGLLWKYRYFVLLAMTANIFAAVFEGSTFAILTIALETLSGDGGINLESLGRGGAWLQARQAALSSTQIFFILILLAVVSQIIRSGLQFGGQTAAIYVTAWSEGDLRRRLFRQYVTMSYAKANSYKIGDLASYTEQVTQVGSLLLNINNLISLTLIVTAYVAVLLWLSWKITLLALLALLLLSLSMGRIIRKVRRLSRRFVDATVAVNAHVVEYLSGLRVIHTFSREEYAVKRTNRIIDGSVRDRRQALIWQATVKPLVESVAIIGLAVFLAIGFGMTSFTGGASISRLGVFVLVMYRLLPRITTLNSYVAGINNWLPFAERSPYVERR